MATVTGTVTEVSGGHLVGRNPQIIFTLNQPNAKAGKMHPTRPLAVTPASDGTWTASLESTTDMIDDAWYTVSIQWQDDGGKPTRMDFPEWALQVPTAGGVFSNLFGKPPANTRMVYVSLTAPTDPRPFMLWLRQDPTNPDAVGSDGSLFEWRNV